MNNDTTTLIAEAEAFDKESNVLYLHSLIAPPQDADSGEDAIIAVYEAVKSMDQKTKAMKPFIEEGKEILKKYMGKSELLVTKDGRQLATWIQQDKRKVFSLELLKENFPLEYELCCTMEDGNKPFCLK